MRSPSALVGKAVVPKEVAVEARGGTRGTGGLDDAERRRRATARPERLPPIENDPAYLTFAD